MRFSEEISKYSSSTSTVCCQTYSKSAAGTTRGFSTTVGIVVQPLVMRSENSDKQAKCRIPASLNFRFTVPAKKWDSFRGGSLPGRVESCKTIRRPRNKVGQVTIGRCIDQSD